MNYLRPSVKRGQIAPDEEDLILRLHRLLGNRWSLIAGRIPGRTDNEIKNYWNTHLSKKLISKGIDPRTHKPFNPSDSINETNKASTSKTHFPNPNPNGGEEEEEARIGNGFFQNNKENQNQTGKGVDFHGYEGLPGSDHGVVGNEEDEDINYCNDDVFSSFLNSLINEDAFGAAQQHHQVLQHQPNGISPFSDPFIPVNAASSTGWESAMMSSTFNQNDNNRVNDHMG
ncbi:hypothetical protein UlMin_033424 [Ulmus minor]